MTDTFSKEDRSQIMRSVKSNQNKSTEIKLIKLFRQYKITGWRRHYKLFGNPDFTFPNKKIAIFTDGCFWHGHKCRNLKPTSNSSYWKIKIQKNKNRDRKVNKILRNKGWKVIRIWECKIKDSRYLKNLFYKIGSDL